MSFRLVWDYLRKRLNCCRLANFAANAVHAVQFMAHSLHITTYIPAHELTWQIEISYFCSD